MFIFSPEHELLVAKQRRHQELIEQARIDSLMRAAKKAETEPTPSRLAGLLQLARTVPGLRRRRRLATG